MRILLLLLALLLGGCSTTQKTTTISEEEAHAAIVEVLHLSGSALDSSALGSLPFTALLKEEQLHILDLDEIPLLEQRLQLWRSGCSRHTAARRGAWARSSTRFSIPW